MIVLLHVVIAVTSLVFASLLLFKPSKTKFHINYGLVSLTLASGTYLVVSTHANIISACITGLMYTFAVSFLSVLAQIKLLKQTNRNKF